MLPRSPSSFPNTCLRPFKISFSNEHSFDGFYDIGATGILVESCSVSIAIFLASRILLCYDLKRFKLYSIHSDGRLSVTVVRVFMFSGCQEVLRCC